MLPLKSVKCCKESIKDRIICNISVCFILISSSNICFGYLLESPQRGDSNRYPKHMLLEVLMQYPCIISYKLLLLERRFCDVQIVSITNFVVVSSVGIKMVNYTVFRFILSSTNLSYKIRKLYRNSVFENKVYHHENIPI